MKFLTALDDYVPGQMPPMLPSKTVGVEIGVLGDYAPGVRLRPRPAVSFRLFCNQGSARDNRAPDDVAQHPNKMVDVTDHEPRAVTSVSQ